MKIIIGDTIPIRDNPHGSNRRYRPMDKVLRKDRRKNRQDRRREVRAGVVVSLSSRTDRRSGNDRRKNHS